MAGGLLNLVSGGTQNEVVYGNPQKTYWTSTYKHITNFGIQNFRLDYEGQRKIQLTTDSIFTFKVRRYAELLTSTYLVIDLPDIYSPIYKTYGVLKNGEMGYMYYPYEFKWIKNIGAMMIRNIKFMIGGSMIQNMSGHDIVALANRDLNKTTKSKWDEMIGNVPDLYDPASSHGNLYPNAVYTDPLGTPYVAGAEPSIRGRQLRIPLPIWWGMNSQQAFPLVCLQYNELSIEVTLRPISELFQICDILNAEASTNVISPNMVTTEHQFNRFINPPPNDGIYPPNTSWYENIHLSCNYVFLSDEEAALFASRPQSYLIREIRDHWFYELNVSDKIWLQNTSGLVLSWMMLFQRSDVQVRNEWSNYTNWPYSYLPNDIQMYPTDNTPDGKHAYNLRGELVYVTGDRRPENVKEILIQMGIVIDGVIREEMKPSSVYTYEQQYLTIDGEGHKSLPGLNCYHFCLKTDPFNLQPSGAMNLSKYGKIELEFVTNAPMINPLADYKVICDIISGDQIATIKDAPKMLLYYYNLLVIEERYNVLRFMSGNAGLMNAR
jgi:hypothetical protein